MSEKPLAERLQVKGDRRLAVVGAPDGMDAAIGCPHARAGLAEAEVVVVFVADRARFDAKLPELLPGLRADTILWIVYPKLTSKLAGDLSRDVIVHAVAAFELATVSAIAIDRDWSALRVKRLPRDRPTRA